MELALVNGKIEAILKSIDKAGKFANNHTKETLKTFFKTTQDTLSRLDNPESAKNIISFYNPLVSILDLLEKNEKIEEKLEPNIEKEIDSIESQIDSFGLDKSLIFKQDTYKNYQELKLKKLAISKSLGDEYVLLKVKIQESLSLVLDTEKFENNYVKDSFGKFLNNLSSIFAKRESSGQTKQIVDNFVSFYGPFNNIFEYLKKNTKIIDEAVILPFTEEIEKVLKTLDKNYCLIYETKSYLNFKDLLKVIKDKESTLVKENPTNLSLINQFKSKEAAQMWLENFQDQETVDWKTFEKGLDKYLKNIKSESLTSQMKRKIREMLDEHRDQKIERKDCDNFFIRVMDNKYTLDIFNSLQMDVVDPTITSCQTLKLRFETYMGTEMNVIHSIRLGDEIVVTPFLTEYTDANGKKHTIAKNLMEETITFGRVSPIAAFIPDIEFDKSMRTMGKKQFNILYKNFQNEKGYYITDLSRLNKTNFLVTSSPYYLNQGMVIELNCCFFHIRSLYPLPSDKKNDAYFVDTIEYKKTENLKDPNKFIAEKEEESDITMKKKKARKPTASTSYEKVNSNKSNEYSDDTEYKTMVRKVPTDSKLYAQPANQAPFLEFIPFDDEPNGKVHENFGKTFKPRDVSKRQIFKIGTHSSNDFRLGPNGFPSACDPNQFNDFHCQIIYEPEKGWTIVERAIDEQKEFSIGTHVCLKNYSKFKEGGLSDAFLIKNDMKISSAHHVFAVKLIDKK